MAHASPNGHIQPATVPGQTVREPTRSALRTAHSSGVRSGSPRVAVIGCGLIGRRRAGVVRRSGPGDLVIVADVDGSCAEAVAGEMGCLATTDWKAAVARGDVDVVIVSTTNNWLAPVSVAALSAGKHVLVEKPMARTVAEALAVLEAARVSNSAERPVVCVGFNHRFHPALRRAHSLAREGAIGELLYIRCRYGHGGRPGYEREWRMDPEVGGGGELLDQGIHVVDLFRWFLGDFAVAFGFVQSYVWRRDGEAQPVEDNGFALFRTSAGQVATLHASCTQWKNLFSFDVTGTEGYLAVEGLGGSYGPERLRVGRRRREGGPPEEDGLEYPEGDVSWEAEWREFVSALREGRQPLAGANEGLQAVRMVYAVYGSARTGEAIRL